MNVDAMATRISVLGRALPMRILIVDDDELELALMADRITAAGFEVGRAVNGAEALRMLGEQWFPVVITDWQMPVMDGIAFTEALRARGTDDTYVIMLTMRETNLDYERGYFAGVDDYLTKKLPDTELFARVHAAFNTLALRRTLKETRAQLASSAPVDTESGAINAQETLQRLHSEVRRAQRYGRMLSVMTVAVRALETDGRTTLTAAELKSIILGIQNTIRTHIDWVGRVSEPPAPAVFAVVLPEASPVDGPAIKERLRAALAHSNQSLAFDFGLASLERGGADGKQVEASELVGVAELCRVCSGHAGPAQLCAVQRSVSSGVTIACRHGYVVESHCTFKSKVSLSEQRSA
jgi:PleD family two-component response regulator